MKFLTILLFLVLADLSLAIQTSDLVSCYEEGKYEEGIEISQNLLLQGLERKEKAKVYQYRGFCYALLNLKEKAIAEFIKALQLWPEIEFIPEFYPIEIQKLWAEAEKKQVKKIIVVPSSASRKSEPKIKPKINWLYFCPGGIIQFKQRRTKTGLSLAILEGLSLGVSFLASSEVKKQWDMELKSWRDVKTAQRWQQIQIISFGIACLTYLYGVWDGIKNR